MPDVILVLKPGYVLYAGSVPVKLMEPVQVTVDHSLIPDLVGANGSAMKAAVADPTVSGTMHSARTVGHK